MREIKINVIYFAPWVTRMSEKALADTVAHEVAHLILGHHDDMNSQTSKVEVDADILAVKWGFKRSYSKAMLMKLERG